MIRINLLPVREARRKAGLRQLAVLLAVTLVEPSSKSKSW